MDEEIVATQEEAPPYRDIEKRIMAARRAPGHGNFPVVKIAVLATLCVAALALCINGLVSVLTDASSEESSALRVAVKSGDSYVMETYSELMASESDVVDFDNPLYLDSVTLEDGVITAQTSASTSGYQFILYQPGSNTFYLQNQAFDAGTSADLVSMGLTSGADYLLCYGNYGSELFRIVACPGGETVEGEDFSLLVDSSLLSTVVLRVS